MNLFDRGSKRDSEQPYDVPLEFYTREGSLRIVSLTVHELASIWG